MKNLLIRGERVVLLRQYENLCTVGSIYQIADFTNTAVILRDPTSFVAKCAVPLDEFDLYFAKDYQGWTDWSPIGGEDGILAWYRSNGKKVQVKDNNGNRGEASCNKTDYFNLQLGIMIAYKRMNLKILYRSLDHSRCELSSLEREKIAAEQAIIKLGKKAVPKLVN